MPTNGVGGQKLIWSGRRDFCRPTGPVFSLWEPKRDAIRTWTNLRSSPTDGAPGSDAGRAPEAFLRLDPEQARPKTSEA
jgi:hypothetical protein